MHKKVVLVYPRYCYKTGDPPLGVCALASYLKERYVDIDITVIDTTFSPGLQSIEQELGVLRPDIVGIYFDITLLERGKIIARLARSSGAMVVAGGPHATIAPEDMLDVVDVVVRGEGEETFAELAARHPERDFKHIQGVVFKQEDDMIYTEARPFIEDLDDLPFVDFSVVDIERYKKYWYYLDSIDPRLKGSTMMVSRGCHFNCTYCQPTLRDMFGERIRYKTPGKVVDEIAFYKERYGLANFFFHDDSLTSSRSWITRFCDELIRQDLSILWGCNSRVDTVSRPLLEHMRSAGARSIHYGIESGNQRIIDEIYDKKITISQIEHAVTDTKKAGIVPMGFFMLGAPGETSAEISETIRFANRLPLREATFSLTTPLKGTRLYDMMNSDGACTLAASSQAFNYYSKRSFVSENGVPNWKIQLLHKYALIRFYAAPRRWKYIFRHFFSIYGIRKFFQKVKRFF